MKDKNNLIWIDLEMTGLSPQKNQILEIATVVTDSQLNILANGPVLAIQTPLEVLQGMDDWNQKQHGSSGLYQRALQSTVTAAQAEKMTIQFLKQFIDPATSPICGNSICMDKQFLVLHMPLLSQFFHYRQIDVSSFKEIFKRWYPEKAKFDKISKHLALNDIYDSIEELKHYREHFIKG
jgi:oligoribonuclease